MDVLAQATMKGAAKCDNLCELQNSVNQPSFECVLCFGDIPECMSMLVSVLQTSKCYHTVLLVCVMCVYVCERVFHTFSVRNAFYFVVANSLWCVVCCCWLVRCCYLCVLNVCDTKLGKQTC